MCGLLLSLNHSPGDVLRGLKSMSYRGAPNEKPRIENALGGWVVGHVRLPIQTDSTFGQQPFACEGEVLAFVGEVFGVPSEEDALWDACRTPDLRGFHQFDGFWSVVHVNMDGRAKVITDYLGTKPLYYWPEQGIVCSEMDPMFVTAGFRPPLDEVYLSNCIKFGYDHSGRTPWEGVVQIPPGTVLTLDPMGHDFDRPPVRYWDWNQVDAPESLSMAFQISVANRVKGILGAENPPALLLSGGLDSTLIYNAAKREGLEVDLYTIHDADDGETPYFVELAAAGQDVTHLVAWDAPTLREIVEHMQAPMDLGSVQPQMVLARAIRESVETKVILTGDGADELFGGYRRAKEYDSQASDVFCELPYYHFPRLDRIHMRRTAEVRSPFISPIVIKKALGVPYEFRTQKECLKVLAHGLGVPPEIINRPKAPLKSSAVRRGGLAYRDQLVRAFRDMVKA